jgi:NAD(P)-dependent dehydrogenase (short-subunit alcohol dehydrogenase family)
LANASGTQAGRTILITGATSGIGLEAARMLAQQGALVAVGARDAARVESVVDEITRGGGRAELFLADVSRLASLREAAARFAAAQAPSPPESGAASPGSGDSSSTGCFHRLRRGPARSCASPRTRTSAA